MFAHFITIFKGDRHFLKNDSTMLLFSLVVEGMLAAMLFLNSDKIERQLPSFISVHGCFNKCQSFNSCPIMKYNT